MRSDIKIRFGKTRGSPEHFFRVQISWDGGYSFGDALVMKRDDSDETDRYDCPYRVEWGATTELEQEAEAALSRLDKRFSAKHTKGELKKFLKGVPRHYVPAEAEVPADLGVRIANAPFRFKRQYGPLETWEREADAAAHRRAGIADQAGDEGGVRMTKMFYWVPWFEELGVKVGEVRREGLVERAKEVDWAGARRAVLAQGDENADPLTFFYHLASIAKGAERRKTVYASVAKEFGIESDLDYGFSDSFIFPQGDPRNVEFHDTGDDPNLLWDMFDQARACGPGGKSHDPAIADTFAKSLQVKGAGIPKLTQVLFLINPRAFLPFDEHAVLPLNVGRFKKPPIKMSWAEYVDEMDRIRTAFPGCHPYEINVIAYLWTDEHLTLNGNRWYQIDARDDEWRDFRDNNWVYLSGQGNPQHGRLDDPQPGDVVLVRSGDTGRARDRDRVPQRLQRTIRSQRPDPRAVGEQEAGGPSPPTCRRSVSRELAAPPTRPSPSPTPIRRPCVCCPPPRTARSPSPTAHGFVQRPRILHPLNTILYGPPGTGKTWHTATRAVAIVENREVSEVAQEDRAAVQRPIRRVPKCRTGRDGHVPTRTPPTRTSSKGSDPS